MNRAEPYAIASRSLEKAQAFATDFHMERAYGSYEEMVNDDLIDLVYVATPHSHHAEHTRLAVDHGKPVLCEKAFTENAAQAREVLAMAEEREVLVAEAIWTRYLPMRSMLDEVLASGIIGNIHMLTANLGYVINHVPRIADPALAGGALLDVGVYPINFMLMALGSSFERFSTSVQMTERGVDAHNSMTFLYPERRMAVLHSTQFALTDRRGLIYGDKGYVEVENINNPEAIRVYDLDYQLVQELIQPPQITGFEYQVEACIDALEAKEIECPQMPHEEIIRVMQIMDDVRAAWGMKYPNE
jgi:predicted dehydrogenase